VNQPSTAIDPPSADSATEFGIPIRNLWYMLIYAWNEAQTKNQWQAEIEKSPNFDALLASILLKLIQQRMRIGLGCSYASEERLLKGIRGRVDFTKSLRRRVFEKGQAYCRFQKYSNNVPKNQIILSTIARLVQIGNFGPDAPQAENLRHRLRRLSRDLESIDIIDLDIGLIRRQQLGRNDNDYRIMLAICELILQRQMPIEFSGQNALPSLDRDMLLLQKVYERFIANFYRLHLRNWLVLAQTRFDWHTKNTSPYLPTMQPDLVLKDQGNGSILILDTKFTEKSLVDGRFGNKGFDSSHLYQIYAYLRSQEHLSEQHHKATGILLYPAARHQLSECVRLQDHNIYLQTIDLADPWESIEHNLLDLVSHTAYDCISGN
jgi:5-methylcytosine-specific restriction enzyme subunit McrC